MLKIYSHRGLNRLAPENTMAAFRLAYEAKIEWIETDVDILGDATPVILHDSTLDRTTDAQGSMYALSRGYLAGISAGAKFQPRVGSAPDYSHEAIPLLDELVAWVSDTGMKCNLELKSNEAGGDMSLRLIDAVVERIAEVPREQLLISSFNPVLLYLLHQRLPLLEVACLFTKDNLWPDAVSICELVGAKTIHPEDSSLTPSIVSRLKAAGLQINVWTVNSVHRARELQSWGVDGVFTDIADELKTALE